MMSESFISAPGKYPFITPSFAVDPSPIDELPACIGLGDMTSNKVDVSNELAPSREVLWVVIVACVLVLIMIVAGASVVKTVLVLIRKRRHKHLADNAVIDYLAPSLGPSSQYLFTRCTFYSFMHEFSTQSIGYII